MEQELDLGKLTMKQLRTKRDFSPTPNTEDRIISSKWWSLYDCIIFERKMGDRLLSSSQPANGRLLIATFTDRLSISFGRRSAKSHPRRFIKVSPIADHKAMKNKEELFNKESRKPAPEKYPLRPSKAQNWYRTEGQGVLRYT